MLARNLAVARRLLPESRVREYLEGAYALSHATVHRSAVHPLYALRSLFRDEIPAAVTALRRHILWVTALFGIAVLAGYWMVHTYPDLIALFASPELIATVERGQLWTEGLLNIVPSCVVTADPDEQHRGEPVCLLRRISLRPRARSTSSVSTA